MSQVVARFLDGRTVKGMTNDFVPPRMLFHVIEDGVIPGTKPVDVKVPDLKAIYFVRSLAGKPQHKDVNEVPNRPVTAGRKVRVTFKDGEVIVGTTQGYHPDRPGFFLVPVDPESNNERCYVVMTSTQSIEFIP